MTYFVSLITSTLAGDDDDVIICACSRSARSVSSSGELINYKTLLKKNNIVILFKN